MNERINLTEDDIEIVYFERYILHIEKTKSKEQAQQLKAQILDDHKIVDAIKEKIEQLNKDDKYTQAFELNELVEKNTTTNIHAIHSMENVKN